LGIVLASPSETGPNPGVTFGAAAESHRRMTAMMGDSPIPFVALIFIDHFKQNISQNFVTMV
jgi:hypothetical protein